MVAHVFATTFHRFMNSGKTSPAIFTCEGDALNGSEQFVVKLLGGMEIRERSAARELYGSLLATYFGIPVPRPVIVEIEQKLLEGAIDFTGDNVRRQQILKDSAGLNFGSQLLANFATWPTDRQPLPAQASSALAIFAFDAMIQNPDRTFKNPNLASRGNEIFIFDHEMAFSFLLNIFPVQEPWKLESETYLAQHVFARVLKNAQLPDGYLTRLSEISTDGILQSISACIPETWKSDEIGKIENHLTSISEHAGLFVDEVLRRLA